MKATFLLILLYSFSQPLFSQINALTESGDEVVLYEDGTWKYLDLNLQKLNTIAENTSPFRKGKEATFLVKSRNNNTGVWIDPNEFKFLKAKENEDAEFEFSAVDKDIYAMMISESTPIELTNLRKVVLANYRAASPDIEVMNQEYRTVNGLKVLMMELKGTVMGIKLTYLGYYYMNSNGTTQLITFTETPKYDLYKDQMQNLLNGLVVQ